MLIALVRYRCIFFLLYIFHLKYPEVIKILNFRLGVDLELELFYWRYFNTLKLQNNSR